MSRAEQAGFLCAASVTVWLAHGTTKKHNNLYLPYVFCLLGCVATTHISSEAAPNNDISKEIVCCPTLMNEIGQLEAREF